MLPRSLRSDFQDLQAWRAGVQEVLDLVARNHEGPVIAPMTLIDHRYFAQIVGRLRHDGHDVRHFALLAERATVLRRLNRRGFGFGLKRERWAVDRLDDCLDRLHEPEFAHHIDTDQLKVPQVADTIARIAGLPVIPDTDGRLRGRAGPPAPCTPLLVPLTRVSASDPLTWRGSRPFARLPNFILRRRRPGGETLRPYSSAH